MMRLDGVTTLGGLKPSLLTASGKNKGGDLHSFAIGAGIVSWMFTPDYFKREPQGLIATRENHIRELTLDIVERSFPKNCLRAASKSTQSGIS